MLFFLCFRINSIFEKKVLSSDNEILGHIKEHVNMWIADKSNVSMSSGRTGGKWIGIRQLIPERANWGETREVYGAWNFHAATLKGN